MHEKDFLINEYSHLSQYMNTGWTLCYTIISGGIVILLSVLNLSLAVPIDTEITIKRILYDIVAILLPLILTIIIGQITASMYLFCLRMKNIAGKFAVKDFWKLWIEQLNTNKQRAFNLYTLAVFRGSKTLGLSLLWVMLFSKWNTPNKYNICELKKRFAGSFPFAVILIISSLFVLIYITISYWPSQKTSFFMTIIAIIAFFGNIHLVGELLDPYQAYNKAKLILKDD